MNQKILIVDDEPGMVEMIKSYFSRQYTVFTACSGKEALQILSNTKLPDLILLDINMPEMDGLTVCQRIRKFVSCPILFLTARIETADKIAGFQVGADDYIVKPFDLEELQARVAAHLRREQRRSDTIAVRYFGELTIDYLARTIQISGNLVNLSRREFDIVELLSLHTGQVFDRERIYEIIWGYERERNSHDSNTHLRAHETLTLI